jgi:hypothetical protein
MTLTPNDLIRQLSVTVDPAFAQASVESYIEMEQRFLAGDWQPTELDGGRLCEAVSRGLLQLDTGKISHKDLPNAIQIVLLDNKKSHNLDWKDRYHIAKAIEVVYKFRSDRGAVHISQTFSANLMDSTFVLHMGKWILAEFLRLAWNRDPNEIAATIEHLVQMEHSLVHELEGKSLVLALNVTAGEEVLILLYHRSENRSSRSKLISDASNQKPDTIRRAITSLISRKEVRVAENDDIVLTPVGQKRVRENLIPKLMPKR